MTKIHPLPTQAKSSNSNHVTSKQESFTIWMKSLLMQSNGCTVYNGNGEIVYRVDNYDKKGNNEVYLMDLKGRVLFTLFKRKTWPFGRWKGYKWDEEPRTRKANPQKPFFQVKRSTCGILRETSFEVTFPCSNGEMGGCYKLEEEASRGKSAFKIVDTNGGLAAEAKRKQLPSGVLLGDDVLTLVVEPHVDTSFVLAIVLVYGLLHHRL